MQINRVSSVHVHTKIWLDMLMYEANLSSETSKQQCATVLHRTIKQNKIICNRSYSYEAISFNTYKYVTLNPISWIIFRVTSINLHKQTDTSISTYPGQLINECSFPSTNRTIEKYRPLLANCHQSYLITLS